MVPKENVTKINFVISDSTLAFIAGVYSIMKL